MNKIRKGDSVVVSAGKDRAKRGRVERVLGDYLFIEGVNLAKKHVKPNPAQSELGGVREVVMPIHVSNVALFDSQSQKASRVGVRSSEGGRRERFFKSTGVRVEGK